MSQRTQLLLFFAAAACMASAMGVHDSIFNNFLTDTFHPSAEARGWLELPRETPGFLVFLTAGIFAAFPLTRVGVIGSLVFGAGMVGMAAFGSSYWVMVGMMMIGSAGMHSLQPVTSTIVLSLSGEHDRGKRMGQWGMVDTLGAVLGTGFVALTFSKTAPQYRTGFMCAAALGCAAAAFYAVMHVPSLHKPRARMVIRRKFWLFYILELLAGARKQIFITFGPWVLIQVYGAQAKSIGALLMTAALIGIVFKPIAGILLDRFGERNIMIFDGVTLTLVCLGYGYAMRLTGTVHAALIVASACYIADNLLFALGNARAIYISRISDSPQELTSTLALGVSINHIVSMTIPIVAGAIWTGFGYERVFLCAAALAAVIIVFVLLVPSHRAIAAARANA